MRRTRRLAIAAAAVTSLALGASVASAAPAPLSGKASCAGAGSSALAPGQGFGTAGERADIAHLVNSAPGPGGQTIKQIAQQKGTADQCFPAGPPA